MSDSLTADINVEIDGTTYYGEYTVNIKKQLLYVRSEYGSKTTYTSAPSEYLKPLENNEGMAKRILREIVEKFLKEQKN